ncbi:helix-turn-helix domain-containing protein [Desulfosediminicola flagellatus]|uniref:helix-turn-helix domain-containing protein n=1 Tax=Desulfosediminicola flagellatus TaxID=2569541 RepID=UPI0010AC41CB|nr:helix-turn-helix transcriptional regulator [Desulfosediminicola flagellatus]
MESENFVKYRNRLGKTQKEIAELLGVSIKTIHSYEQGWRKIPNYIERQVFFLLSNRRKHVESAPPCWEVKQCGLKEQCPAWEYNCGHLCWFISGTKCCCTKGCSLEEKTAKCLSCDILKSRLE